MHAEQLSTCGAQAEEKVLTAADSEDRSDVDVFNAESHSNIQV